MRRQTLALVLGVVVPTLALSLGWLVTTVRARDGRIAEQRARLARSAEAVSAAVDESLEELRRREDARPFYLYDHYYLPPDVVSLGAAIAVSPLAGAPDDPRVVGYFQVDPGGRLRTPYAPEPGDVSDPRAARVVAIASRPELSSLFGLAYLANGATEGPLALHTAPQPTPPMALATARPAPIRHAHAARGLAPVIDTANGAVAENAPPRQATVELNSYSNRLYDDVTHAQAGDTGAQARVVSAQQATSYDRNPVSWESQVAQQVVDTGTAPPVLHNFAPPETGPRDVVNRPQAQHSAPQARLHRTAASVDVPTIPSPPRAPDRADAVDYTPMAFGTFGEGGRSRPDAPTVLVLSRVVSHDGASSVQGVVLDRTALVRDWLPALARRHAIDGAVPAVLDATPPSSCDVTRPVSARLAGVTLCFSRGTLARARAGEDRALALQLAALLVLVLASVLAAFVIDRASRRAAELARQKTAFVSSVSHELRTPLTTIRMYAEMLRDGLVPEAKRPKFHADIAQESVRLGRLVENVLEATRLEEGQRPLRSTEGDLAAHVRNVAEGQRRLCESRDFALTIDAPSSLRSRFDAQALELVVVNLLENAVKYGAGRERTIDVALRETAVGVELHVMDRGPGIPEREREKVFERFHRVEQKGVEHVVGTGLGLALVRELARAHGGDARALAREGGGTDVVVSLPSPRKE